MSKRSIWAIVAGVVVTIVVTTLVDVALHVAGVYGPPRQPLTDGLALLALSYRIVITVAAAWLTARLAPDRPLRHAIMLGYVGTVLGLIAAAATWNRGLGPHWYAIAIALLALPECWVGGKLYELQARNG
jgi:hypothetical protein